MTEHTCYIEQFPHRLPHRDEAELRPCGHYACPPHTITYYGTGDDDELVGDYCMVCYARKFPEHCPDRLILQAVLQESVQGGREGLAQPLSPSTATQVPMTEEQMRAAYVGELTPLAGSIHITDYNPEWPRLFEREAKRIRAALGDRVLLLEHVGSTSVPGLAAKPRIDVLLVVADSADESNYVPALEAAAYVLRIREPDWYEHRMFNGPDTDINLHVFSPGCVEIDRMLLFRNWLRSNASDRRLYERTKRELARQDWKYTQNYADAKTAVVEEILARARGDAGEETTGPSV